MDAKVFPQDLSPFGPGLDLFKWYKDQGCLLYRKSPLWHAKNYALIMFYCRGMNFIDLVKLKVNNIEADRLLYGRSKTGDPFSVKITESLGNILKFYLKGKRPEDYLFPTNYDGSTKHFQKYKSQRRRMNERLKIIAKDAGIEGEFTTYYIRHSWATIAKFMGISTEIISEGLGHNSLRTTEIYLKSFTYNVLDEANELVIY
jgi:integrase